MEGRYDAVRGHRTRSNRSPPLSVPVSPLPVSREASRDFVALDMWLHTRCQISKINVWWHIVYLVYTFFFGFGLVGLGTIFYSLDSESEIMLYSI